MLINIKPRDNDVRAMYENHSTHHEGDAGLDLFVLEDHIVGGGVLAHTIDFGIQCEPSDMLTESMPNEKTYQVTCRPRDTTGYILAPRSSISKTPLRMSNSIGIIDAGYRGNIMAKIDNLSSEPYTIRKGERLFQLVDPRMYQMNFALVEKLSDTSRGSGGFGSTG